MHLSLTKSNMFLIQYIAILLGLLMNGIYYVINGIGLPNVSLAIIIFTIIVYAALTPLQVKQQKFSRMNAIMAPEIKNIQEKYRNKRDQLSQQKMADETQAVYKKYGVSATGSCLQLLIQMPILFGLYQVIYHIPGYITLIYDKIETVINASGFSDFLTNFVNNAGNSTLTTTLTSSPTTETMIDTVYKLNTTQWADILSQASGKSFEGTLSSVHDYVTQVTNFLSLNISDSPSNVFITGWQSGAFLMVIVAILFPVLAWLTQWINTKMVPVSGDAANTMKSMNLIMPLISAIFCFTLPIGIGVYWIIGAVVRTVQMFIINKTMAKEDIKDVIAKNQEKMRKKAEKKGSSAASIARNTTINTRNLENPNAPQKTKRQELEERMKRLEANDQKSAQDGSIASKVNMVSDYNSKHENTRKHLDAKKK